MFVNEINSRIIVARSLLVLSMCVFTVSCANSKIITSWVEPEHKKVYQYPMIIGVSDSQQTRHIYEDHFVNTLQKHGIRSIPSYKLISSKQKMNRDTVVDTIKNNADIDAVIITYLIADDAEVTHSTSPINAGYSGSVEDNQLSATIISTRGRSSSTEIVTLKIDVYDSASHSLVWTVQTRTVAPESIDEVVTDITELLVNKLITDDIVKGGPVLEDGT